MHCTDFYSSCISMGLKSCDINVQMKLLFVVLFVLILKFSVYGTGEPKPVFKGCPCWHEGGSG